MRARDDLLALLGMPGHLDVLRVAQHHVPDVVKVGGGA